MSSGHRKSPKGSRSKKGQSGSSKRRPKQAAQRLSAAQLFRKIANERVGIDGKKEMMTRWEALTRQIYIMAYNNESAARLLHQIRKLFPGDRSIGDKPIAVFSDNEMKY
jgi:hypothetical protein